MSRLHVLLIDPDRDSASTTAQLLRRCGPALQVHTVPDPAAALAQLAAPASIHVILFDRSTPPQDEAQLWTAAQAAAEPIPVVILSESGEDAAVSEARQRGATQFVQKPLDAAALKSVLSTSGMFTFSVSRRP